MLSLLGRSLVVTLALLGSSVPAYSVDFALQDINGQERRLSDYRGKWVVVNYWATWCPPCIEELPDLSRFHNRHKDKDAVVLGVNSEDIDAATLREFVKMHSVSYPILLGSPSPNSPLGPVPGLPTTYVVSPDGEVAARNVGPITSATIERFIANSDKKPK